MNEIDFRKLELNVYHILDKYFKGSYTAQYEFISDNRDAKIKVEQIETDYDDVEASFKVGKVEFRPVATGIFGG